MITLNIKRLLIIAVVIYVLTKYFIFGLIPVLFLGGAAYYVITKWGTGSGNASN